MAQDGSRERRWLVSRNCCDGTILTIRFRTRSIAQGVVPVCFAISPTGSRIRAGRFAQQEHLRHLPSFRHCPAHARAQRLDACQRRRQFIPQSSPRFPYPTQIFWIRLDRMQRSIACRTRKRTKGCYSVWPRFERPCSSMGASQ